MATERLISLDAVIKKLKDELQNCKPIEFWDDYITEYKKRVIPKLLRDVINYLENQPTVANPIVHGHWISDKGDILFHCSECETQISTSWDYDDLYWGYCPNCGAKMDGDENG